MSGYRLKLFGGFDLRDDRGEPVKVVSKKGRCLLACLALAQGQAIHRDRLAGLLWGDRNDTRARHSLSQALYRLRGLFPEDVQAGFDLSADTVGLAAELFDVDVLRFEAGLNGRDKEAAEAALGLYADDLLEGLEVGQEGFDAWLTTERERLRDRAITGWRELMRQRTDGPPKRAIDAATKLLGIEPTDEDAHRALMDLYAKTERRDLALRQYERCKELLMTELGVEPAAKTQELRKRIEQEPRQRPSSQSEDTPPPVDKTPREPSARVEPVAEPKTTAAERRQVTVLQCDLAISTPSSGPLDPEDRREVVRSAREECADIISQYDGHMAKFVGDGFLAYFGFPQAHEDDAARAAHAALSIRESMQQMQLGPHMQVKARVGIATGLVVVADAFGGGLSEEQAISGEAPNLASRLQHIAAPGEVLISDSTRRLLDTSFEVENLEPQSREGSLDSVRSWRITGQRQVESRFEARQGGALTAFVGREDEIDLLLRRWNRAKSGEGQIVLISGEPGIGKSRLTQIVHERLADGPHTRLRFQCSPHHMNSALYPIITQLEFASGIGPADSAAERLDKLEALLVQGTEDVKSIVPLFADLLLISHDGRYSCLNLTPQAQKARTLEALNDQLVGLARKQPVLLVFEDLHWIDPTTQEDLDLMVERIQDAPVLALLTFRPEYHAPWVGQPHVHVMALNRLTRRESLELVRNVAAAADLDADVLDEVAAKADGVPLFMEELTHALLDGGSSGIIPETIQASLLARFDRLGPAKEVAQIGAVIGREFRRQLIAAVSDLDEAALDERLSALTDSQLVFVRGAPPDATYMFKHALIQDAAYESLLKSRRRSLHARVADELLATSPGIAESQPELLAHHCTEARLTKQAVDYWQRAGQRALEGSANAEAITHARTGLSLLDAIGDEGERLRAELGLQSTLGNALLAIHGYGAPATGKAYRRALELCEHFGDEKSIPAILNGLHGFHDVRAEHHEALQLALKEWDRVKDGNDDAAKVVALFLRAIDHLFLGEPLKAAECFESMIQKHDLEELMFPPPRYPQETGVCGRSFYAWELQILGYPDMARGLLEKTMRRARELEHAHTIAFVMYFATVLIGDRGDSDKYLAIAEENVAWCTEHRLSFWLTWAMFFKAHAAAKANQASADLHELRKRIADAARHGPIYQPTLLSLLAEILGNCGRQREGLDACDMALEVVDRTDERWHEAETHRVKGNLLRLPEPDEPAAETCLSQAVDVARHQGAKWFELRAAKDLAFLWRDQGKAKEARDLPGSRLQLVHRGLRHR